VDIYRKRRQGEKIMKKKTQIVNGFTGSVGWLIFWLIMGGFLGLVYLALRWGPKEVEIKRGK